MLESTVSSYCCDATVVVLLPKLLCWYHSYGVDAHLFQFLADFSQGSPTSAAEETVKDASDVPPKDMQPIPCHVRPVRACVSARVRACGWVNVCLNKTLCLMFYPCSTQRYSAHSLSCKICVWKWGNQLFICMTLILALNYKKLLIIFPLSWFKIRWILWTSISKMDDTSVSTATKDFRKDIG